MVVPRRESLQEIKTYVLFLTVLCYDKGQDTAENEWRGGGQMVRDMGGLRPIDDLMFRVMARSEAFCGEVLRVLLVADRKSVV